MTIDRYIINYDERGEQKHPNGDFVHWEDCATLEAENAALKASDAEWGRLHQVVIEERAAALRDVSRLKAEVERLSALTPQDAGEAVAAPSWVMVPKKLTFGMRVALEEAIIRHDKNLDRVWSEVLDFAPAPPVGEPTEGEVEAALRKSLEAMQYVFMACPVPSLSPQRRAWASLVDAIEAAGVLLASRKGRAGE